MTTPKYWISMSVNTSLKSSDPAAWQVSGIGEPTTERPMSYWDERIVQSGETFNNVAHYVGIFAKRSDAVAALADFVPASVLKTHLGADWAA